MWDNLTLTLVAAISAFLYVWFGVGFGLLALSIIGFAGIPLAKLVGLILFTQAIAAIYGSLLRSAGGAKAPRGAPLFVGISAATAFTVAGALGVKIADKHRLLAVAVLLLLAAVVRKPKKMASVESVDKLLAIGLFAGAVKALVGGGLTPLFYIAYRLSGHDFDNAIHRTLVSEVAVCFAAAAPYLLTYSLDPLQLLACLTGVAIGGLVGLPLRQLEIAREAVARPLMGFLGAMVAVYTLTRNDI